MAGLVFVKGGTINCTSAAQLVASGSLGYLTITNLDGTNTIYIGNSSGVSSTNGLPIPPGGSDTAYYADVTSIWVVGSSTVGWGLRT